MNHSVAFSNTSNISTSSLFSKASLTTWAGIDLGFCVIGSLASVLVIILILSKTQLRRGCGSLVVQSLIANFLLCATSFPITCILVYRKNAGLGSIPPKHCNIVMWLQMTFRCSVNWMEVCIAMNRIVAIYFPHQYSMLTGKRFTTCTTIVVWLASAVYALFPWIDVGGGYVLTNLGNCAIVVRSDTLGILNHVFGSYLPIAVSFGCFGLLYIQIFIGKCVSAGRNVKQQSRKLKLVPALFAAFVWNSVCFLYMPVALGIWPDIFKAEPKLVLFFMTLTVLGYGLQPVIYCALNKDYRTAFWLYVSPGSYFVKPMRMESAGKNTRPSTISSSKQDTTETQNG